MRSWRNSADCARIQGNRATVSTRLRTERRMWNPLLLAWLTKLLWTPKPTHKILGLPRPTSARVLAILEAIDDNMSAEVADEIRADAHDAFRESMRERHVPDGVYELIIPEGLNEHRVRRCTDGCSWSLADFDDFIDLGLKPRGD
jgi:hypothetical protein